MTETMEYWAAEELDDADLNNLRECEQKVSYQFRDLRFLHQALTHSSIKTIDNPSNERLEFLGDSVLGLVMTEFLYNFFQHRDEGELTQIKSVVVSTNILAEESQRLGLGGHYNVGKGVTRRKKLPNSLLANVFEAVVAAIYKDGGLEVARRFVLRNIYHQVLKVASDEHHRNYKSLLQQWAQRVLGLTPTYRVISEQGPDHMKSFEVVAVIGDKRYAIGKGTAKKEAEQEAARITLTMLDDDENEEEKED
ncbi:MAG: ribonuclease III [Planctomycetota bacterium]